MPRATRRLAPRLRAVPIRGRHHAARRAMLVAHAAARLFLHGSFVLRAMEHPATRRGSKRAAVYAYRRHCAAHLCLCGRGGRLRLDCATRRAASSGTGAPHAQDVQYGQIILPRGQFHRGSGCLGRAHVVRHPSAIARQQPSPSGFSADADDDGAASAAAAEWRAAAEHRGCLLHAELALRLSLLYGGTLL